MMTMRQYMLSTVLWLLYPRQMMAGAEAAVVLCPANEPVIAPGAICALEVPLHVEQVRALRTGPHSLAARLEAWRPRAVFWMPRQDSRRAA